MRQSIVGAELPTRPPPRLPQIGGSSDTAITENILSLPWTEARVMLLNSGVWVEPSEAYADPELVVGKRVWIDGQVRRPGCTVVPRSQTACPLASTSSKTPRRASSSPHIRLLTDTIYMCIRCMCAYE